MKVKPLILGLSGYELTPAEEEVFRLVNPVGFILFDRNLRSEAQILNLTTKLKSLFERPIYILIDEEGGKVSRLTTSGLVPKGTFPPAYSFYELYEKEGLERAKQATEENYLAIGHKLKSLGIDGSFAPVADLLHPGAHNVIGNRSFGPIPEIAIQLCRSAIAGLERAGAISCIKHILGHGLANVDSHVSLPVVEKDINFLQNNDFLVFKQLDGCCKFAMTAHVVYKCLDPENPITTSKSAIEYIKKNIFNGLLISDDITMGALGENIIDNAKRSFEAGCDIILYCNYDVDTIEKLGELFP